MYREISWYIGGKIMLPTRKNIRLPNYDYRQEGMYFITICTKGKRTILGTVTQDSILLSAYGKIAEQVLIQIQNTHIEASIIQHTIMPNHVHAILFIKNNASVSLGQMIRQFKAKTSYLCRQSIWQRNYYEHVIRSQIELCEIMTYIENNPLQWALDKEYMP
jgi:REP element-mobilizing transposase RayT